MPTQKAAYVVPLEEQLRVGTIQEPYAASTSPDWTATAYPAQFSEVEFEPYAILGAAFKNVGSKADAEDTSPTPEPRNSPKTTAAAKSNRNCFDMSTLAFSYI
jgi:hypothetical protein